MNIPHDTTGRSPASPGILTVFPVIEIRGDWLIWDASGEVKSKPTPRNLLERFCDLNGLDESAILRFARSSGPLGHCKHGSMACCDGWNEVGGPLFADSIKGWRRLSAIVAGLCRVAARVAHQQTSLRSDWLVYWGQCPWLGVATRTLFWYVRMSLGEECVRRNSWAFASGGSPTMPA